MAIVHVATQEEFDKEVKKADSLVLVDFWAPWCGPCKMLAPVYEAMAEQYKDVKFVKVDVDEAEPEVSSQFNIMSIPTVIAFKDSKAVDQKLGAMTKDQLKEFLEKNRG